MKEKEKYSINSLPVLLRNPKILLIGGGKVALQKIKVLLKNNIDFFVIAQEICSELKNYRFHYFEKKFEKEDAKNYNIIINATGSKEVNELIKEIKRERFVLLNTVDIPEECDFYFSSLLVYKNLKIAVSSNGASPTITQIVRNKIKEYLPSQLGSLSEKKLLQRERGIINPEETLKETLKLFGRVYLIGCGIGGVDMLTVKAYNLLQNGVDVVLYDHLVSEDILEIIPERVEKIYSGKCKGKHSMPQDEINRLMLDYASRGFRVGRLKNGDPYLFGRGAEEAIFLINNNIEIEIVPGLSSINTAPLCAGIPPTAREISSSVSVVTAHLKNCIFDSSWIDLLKRKNHTTIVLMGLTQTENIIKHAAEQGVDEDTPAAVISNAGRINQKVLTGTLKNLIELANNASSPAVIVFGDVVNFSKILPHFSTNKMYEDAKC